MGSGQDGTDNGLCLQLVMATEQLKAAVSSPTCLTLGVNRVLHAFIHLFTTCGQPTFHGVLLMGQTLVSACSSLRPQDQLSAAVSSPTCLTLGANRLVQAVIHLFDTGGQPTFQDVLLKGQTRSLLACTLAMGIRYC